MTELNNTLFYGTIALGVLLFIAVALMGHAAGEIKKNGEGE